MPTYKVTDPSTGKTMKLTGDSPPTEEELTEIFGAKPSPKPVSNERIEKVPQWGMENPNLYGLYGAGKALISEGVKPTLETLGAIGGSLVSSVAGTALGYGIGKKAGEMIETAYGKLEAPDMPTKGIGEEMVSSAVDVGSAMALGKGMDVAGKHLWRAESKITEYVKNGFNKGVKPTVVGKNDSPQVINYFQRAEEAVKSIVARNEGRVPKNMNDFSNMIHETKVKVWDQSTGMAEKAGTEGFRVDLNPSIMEMEALGKSAELRRVNPNEADRLLKLAAEWKQQPTSVTPQEAEKLLASLNNEAKSWWKDPNPNNVHAALNFERTANNVRQALYESIPEGAEYQALRQEYGALTSIEKEVTNRAIVYDRENPKGFFDLAGIHGTGAFIHGLVAMNPGTLVAGAAIKGAVKYTKWANSPDRIVGSMFRKVQKEMVKSGQAPPPQEPIPFFVEGKPSDFMGENFAPEYFGEQATGFTPYQPATGPLKAPMRRSPKELLEME